MTSVVWRGVGEAFECSASCCEGIESLPKKRGGPQKRVIDRVARRHKKSVNGRRDAGYGRKLLTGEALDEG